MHLVQIHNLGPSNAAGAIIRTGAGGVPQYLPIGAAAQVLTVVAGAPTWNTLPTMTVAGDLGTNPNIVIGTDTLSILGGLGIDTTGSTGADSITIALNAVLDDLSNVVAPAPTVGQNLAFDGVNWVNQDALQFGEYQTTFDASGGVFPGGPTIIAADWFNTTVAGVVDGQSFSIGDLLIAIVDNPSNATFAGNWIGVSPIGSFSQFTVAADGGPAQTILNLDTLNIVGGTNITTTMSASDIVTIDWAAAISDLSDVNTAGAASTSVLYFDGVEWVDSAAGANGQVFTITAGVPGWAAIPSQTLNVIASAGTNPAVILGSESLSILAGTGITTTGNAGADSVTIALNAALNDLTDTTIAAPVANQLLAYNGAQWVNTTGCTWLSNFSVDCMSDVTVVAPGVGDYLAWDGVAWVNTAPAGGFTSFDVAGDAGPNQTIGNLNVLTLIGGTNISTLASAGDNVTINMDPFSINFLSDVDTTGVAVNNALIWTGAQWEDVDGCTWLGNFSIDCLSDVVTAGVATGSMLYFDGTNFVDLGIGAANQVLTVSGGIPTWANNPDVTTASNVNVGGVGVYDGTVGNDLQFKGINNGNAAISITDDAGNNEIDVAVVLSGNAGQTLSIGATGLGSIQAVDEFTNVADGSTTVTLSTTPLAGALRFLYVDGVLQPQSEIVSVVGTLLTFATATSSPGGGPANATDITVVYWIPTT